MLKIKLKATSVLVALFLYVSFISLYFYSKGFLIFEQLVFIFAFFLGIIYLYLIYNLYKKKGLSAFLSPLFTESKLIKDSSKKDEKIEKLNKLRREDKARINLFTEEIISLKEKISIYEKRLKGKDRIQFFFNSEEEEKLTDKIQEMLKKSPGKQIRYIGLVDGMFKTNLIKSLEEGNLKLILRRIEKGENIIPFCQLLNEKGKIKRWTTKKNENIHGRILIIGNEEVLITTSDIVKDVHSRVDFGLWTNDKKIIQEAINCFDKLYKSKRTLDFNPIVKKKKRD